MILGAGNFPVIEIKKVGNHVIINEIWGVKTIESNKVLLSSPVEVIEYDKEKLLKRLRYYIDKYGLDYAEVDGKTLTWKLSPDDVLMEVI